MEQRGLFELIFSDALLVDIDMSVWDKHIALYVLADHVRPPGMSTLPLFAVELARVRRFDFTFNHLSHEPPIELGPEEHVQWWIDHFDIKQIDGNFEIALTGGSSTPVIHIVCENVHIWELSIETINRLFPGWNKPSTGLIRPGLDILSGYDYADRLQAREYADRRLLGKHRARR